MTCSTLEKELERFREAYEGVKCTVGANDIVYRTTRGYARKAAKKANSLIELMGLNLTAIPTPHNANDSFVVQSNETDAL